MKKEYIGLIVTISIFISMVFAFIFYNMENKTEKSKFFLKNGWIILLIIQAVYLSLDIVESVKEEVLYGIIASSFMIGLGFFILTITMLEKFHHGELELHGIIEGMFYLLFGIILLIIRLRNQKKEKEEEEEEEEEEEKEEN